MGLRRMFSRTITESGRFLKMPPSSQALYFQLGMNADDDGVVEAYKVMKLTASNDDDLKVLVSKNFIKILNEDLVSFVMDWTEHNLLRADRKIDSIYKELLLEMVPNVDILRAKPRADTLKLTGENKSGKALDVQCPPNVRVSKDKISKELYIKELFEKEITIPRNEHYEFLLEEKQKFIDYWTEKSIKGKKERWEKQPVFDIKRRWRTWTNNLDHKMKAKPFFNEPFKKGNSFSRGEGFKRI